MKPPRSSGVQSTETQKKIAQSIKERRIAREWSLDRMANATGVSKAMLGQIERGESSPTVATLWKIATGLKLPLTELLETPPAVEMSNDGVYVRRDAAELRVQPADEGMIRAILFPYEDRFGFELYELTLAPGFESISEPHEPGVVEHVSVIEGEMELLIEGEWQRLSAGQSVRFPADRRHGYRNCTSQPARLHDIIHYPAKPKGSG